MKEVLLQLAEKRSISEKVMEETVRNLLKEGSTESEIAAFMMGLKSKGETVEEISGIVHALKKETKHYNGLPFVLDNCGTGGDGSSSFNISTTSAFVIAAAGIPVAKHGNRSISSKTGSADVLEYLGVGLELKPEMTVEILKEVGIAFLYAPHVHPKLKKIITVRKQLKIPTIFNYIGPLTNPVELDYQLLGINNGSYLRTFAEVLKKLGRKRAVVVNGAGSMDEASLQGKNRLVILEDGVITERTLTPEDVGLPVYDNREIKGGYAKENAEILLSVLQGNRGAYRDTVLLNAGLGIYTGGKAKTIEEGIHKAGQLIDSGEALKKLNMLINYTRTAQKEAI